MGALFRAQPSWANAIGPDKKEPPPQWVGSAAAGVLGSA